MRAIQAANAVVPKRRSGIVVHSIPDLEDGALAVLDELQARGHDPVVLREEQSEDAVSHRLGSAIEHHHKNSRQGRVSFLRARTVITTHSVYSNHRPPRGQRIVNLWHGEPLTKPVALWDGASSPHPTIATALSNVGKAFRCAEFGMDPAHVKVIGAPRNDRLVRADGAGVRAKALRGSPATRLLLWLPTYRQGTWSGRLDGLEYPGLLPLEDEWTGRLDDLLEESNAVLLVKPHPLAPNPPPGEGRRIVAIDEPWLRRRELSLYELLKGANALITDISSVWIDYLLTDQPVIFHFPDLGAYRQTRGIHLEPYESWVPGPVTQNGAALVDAVDRVLGGGDGFGEERRLARRRLHRFDDDLSTQRLLDELGL